MSTHTEQDQRGLDMTKLELPPCPNPPKNAQDAQFAFICKFVEAKLETVSFVDSRLGWKGAGEFLEYFKSSFNLSIAVRNRKTNERALIRFPFPGKVCEPWREKKVKNKVVVISYLSRYTSIPIPRVYHWGLTKESPQQLGPFMIEEFMEGENLGDILKKPIENDADPAILDSDIDEAKLNIVYEQVAGFILELSRLEFPLIGAISKDTVFDRWTVTEPPLTYDMTEVVSFAGFPADHFKTMSTLTRSRDYLAARAELLHAHLEAQRNTGFEDGDIT